MPAGAPDDGRTLFIVGDPKQSIYGFRKAEVSLFMKARNGLPLPGQGLLPLKPVYITTNFRSRKELIDFTNDLFSKTIMAHPNLEADEVPFLEAQAAPEMLAKDPGQIKLALFSKEEDSNQSRLKEAAWLAGAVNQADQDPRSGSIGILLFARTHLPLYLKALYEQGLQVQVQEGLNLEDRPEVQDLFSLTRSLVRPHDDLAWASLVRSAWCWVGLDDLLQISRLPAVILCRKNRDLLSNAASPGVCQKSWTGFWALSKPGRPSPFASGGAEDLGRIIRPEAGGRTLRSVRRPKLPAIFTTSVSGRKRSAGRNLDPVWNFFWLRLMPRRIPWLLVPRLLS